MFRNITLITMAVVLGLAVFAGCSKDAVTTGSDTGFEREVHKAYGYVYEGMDPAEADVTLYVADEEEWDFVDTFDTGNNASGYYQVEPLWSGLNFKLECDLDGNIKTHYFQHFGDEYHIFWY